MIVPTVSHPEAESGNWLAVRSPFDVGVETNPLLPEVQWGILGSVPTYLGIDLGTTNSLAAVFDGKELQVVRSEQGTELTPSVVRFDARGNVTVGQRARKHLEKDPANTVTEFKRLLGSAHLFDLPAAGIKRSPVELSAEVLKSLRKDAETKLGFAPGRAVISVPALFELPQTQATAEAARLAGFDSVEMIQEPVASALAAGWSDSSEGAWLVYDLGGGTFDVSLLETQEGLLRVVGHDGDNFLGGRDFDTALVAWALERLAETGVEIERDDAARELGVRQLRSAAEEAKIELTRNPRASLLVPDTLAGEEVELEVDRSTLERLIEPIVERSIAVCLRLLRAHGLDGSGPGGLGRVVLVGGPTVMPLVRRKVVESLGAPLVEGLDPMTLVARGAALFAATAGLEARTLPEQLPGANRGPRAWLQYPAMTSDTAPFVVGRVLAEKSIGIQGVLVRRADGGWQSELELLDPEGAFAVQVSLPVRECATFEIYGVNGQGQRVVLEPPTFSIVHGVSLGDPPLSRTLGVALANDHVRVFFERGSPLPMRRTFVLETVESVSPGIAGFALRIPLIQGELPRAHLCRLVGAVEIPSERLKKALPAGSKVELSLELDRAGALRASARIPILNEIFDKVVQLVTPTTSPALLREAVGRMRSRSAELSGKAFRQGNGKRVALLSQLEGRFAEVARDLDTACSGDPDSLEKARRGTSDLEVALEQLEGEEAWPEFVDELRRRHSKWLGWVAQNGTEDERSAVSKATAAMERAIAAKSGREAERQLSVIRQLGNACYFREPNAWEWELDHCEEQVGEAVDPRRARQLVEEGRKALAQGDRVGVKQAVQALWQLQPADEQERRLGHSSGVR